MPTLRTHRFLRVKLDMVSHCQLRCAMCHFAHPEFRAGTATMDRTLLERVARELFPRAHDVVLSSGAEPLLSPELPRAIELCREYEVPSFHFSTNGMALTRRVVERLVDARMPLLTLSVDGGTKQTFESIRSPMTWELLLEKFDLIAAVKRQRASKLPVLTVTSVLMRRTIRELPALIRLMHEKGVERMNFVHMNVIGGLGVEHESLVHEPELCNDVLQESQAVCRELGMDACFPIPFSVGAHYPAGGGRPQPIPHHEFMNHKNREFMLAVPDKDHHSRSCYFPWYYIHVNPDGTVFPCGAWFELVPFGNLRTQSFEQIWTGDQYRRLRREHSAGPLRPVCSKCSVATMGRPDAEHSFGERAPLVREALRATAPDPGPGPADRT